MLSMMLLPSVVAGAVIFDRAAWMAAACTRVPCEIYGPGVPFHMEGLALAWNFESSSLKSSERGSAHPAF